MTEKIKQTLSESKTARWVVLALISFTMLTGYLFADVLSPLKPMLLENASLDWNNSSYGFFTGAYSLFNVFFLFLIIGGVILDKLGIRFTGTVFISLMVVGALINYYALTDAFVSGGFGYEFLGSFFPNYSPSVKMAAFGYAIFGVGVEIAGITVSKTIVKWFKGKEMALAMGLEMATARFGMLGAFWFSTRVAGAEKIITRPVAFAILLLVIGLLTFLVYTIMDVKLDKQTGDDVKVTEPEDEFKISDIGKLFTNRAFMYIAMLCVLFYAAVFPFMKYAADLFVNRFGTSVDQGAFIAGLLPLGTMALTPLFGTFLDKKGKGASIMIFGSILLIIVHLAFALAPATTFVAWAGMIVLGIGFSLVPASMWPSVPKIVEDRYLGSAFAVIFMIQNIGLMVIPMLIGWVLDKVNPGVTAQIQQGVEGAHYNYTIPMLVFVACGVLALLFAFLLKAEDRKKGYGLELPNIQK
ncbi:MAG: MFS transporter [Salinivirgaceae bacterium]|nr:MFS transporter [Salinivirgaceae bacterium]